MSVAGSSHATEPYHLIQYRLYRDHVPPDPWEMAMEPADNENWPDPEKSLIHCSSPGCLKTKPDHQWAYKTPEGKDWLDQRDGTSWCPDHIPAWYARWKAEKEAKGR